MSKPSNKIVLITGATSGIGEACAFRFAESKDYDLILTGRNLEQLGLLQSRLQSDDTDVKILQFDVRNRESVKKELDTLHGKWKDIDVIINNAGLALGLDNIQDGSFDDWETMIDTNIKGLLNVSRLLLPNLIKRNKGHIINIGSVAGDAAYAKGNVYCATKAAVKAISDGMRIDVANTCIRITNIKPGLVETNFSKTRFHGDEEKAHNVYEGIKPLTGADVADVVFYAASAPEHVQIAEVLVLATHQANGSTIYRESK